MKIQDEELAHLRELAHEAHLRGGLEDAHFPDACPQWREPLIALIDIQSTEWKEYLKHRRPLTDED